MAHSYHGKSANFFYNGDFSGEITISVKSESSEEYVEVKVESEDILGLVADHLRSEIIGEVEQMDAKQLLSLFKK